MTMLPDIEQEGWDQFQTDQFVRDTDHTIGSLGFEHQANEQIADLSRIGAWAALPPPEPPPESPPAAAPEPEPVAVPSAVPVPPPSPSGAALPTAPPVAPAASPSGLPDWFPKLELPEWFPKPAGREETAPSPAAAPVARGGPLQDYARQAALREGLDPDIFVRQIQQESGFNPNARSPAGATGIAQFMPATAAGMGIDPTDPYAALDASAKLNASNLRKYGGDYAKALAAYNAGPGNVDKYGGVPPFAETQHYVDVILGGKNPPPREVTPQEGLTRAGAAIGAAYKDISQFGDAQLTNDESYAACGPAAAVRFAQKFGRNPTLREALDLAKTLGWTSSQGMAGLSSEKALMDKIGVPTKLVSGADWGTFANEAKTGNPVTISTQGHYFTADGWDPNTNRFHVGRSGLDLRGGSEWMTPEQMTAIMGPVQGGLLADNPQVAAPSIADQDTNPGSWLDRSRNAMVESFNPPTEVQQAKRTRAVSAIAPEEDLTQQAASFGVTPLSQIQPSAITPESQPEQSVWDRVGSGIADVFKNAFGGGTQPVNVPGGGYEVPRSVPTAPAEGIPERRDVRDIVQGPQPTVGEAVQQFFTPDQNIPPAQGTPIEGTLGVEGIEPRTAWNELMKKRQELWPTILEPQHPLNQMQVLEDKYGPFWMRHVDEMPPEDQEKARGAMLAVGGVEMPGMGEVPGILRRAPSAARVLTEGEQALADAAAASEARANGQDQLRSLFEPQPSAPSSELYVPGREAPTEGVTQIYGPRGEPISTVARAEDVTGIVRTGRGAEVGAPSAETLERLPNLSKLAPEAPDIQASLQRVAEDNPELMDQARRGVITHEQLVNELAPQVGMSVKEFLKTPFGKVFNAEEGVVLRSALVDARANLRKAAQQVEEKGGLDALSADERLAFLNQVVDASRLQSVAKGGATELGRGLNAQKIKITEPLAQSVTAAQESRVLRDNANRTARRAEQTDAVAERAQQTRQQRQATRDAAKKAVEEGAAPKEVQSILRQIDQAYQDLEQYQNMSLAEKDDVFKARQEAREAAAAMREDALKEPDALNETLKQLRKELDAEQKNFAGRREEWGDMAFWAEKRGEILKQRGAEGQVAWLEAERKAARNAANQANKAAEKQWNQALRAAELQKNQAAAILEKLGGREVTDDLLRDFLKVMAKDDPMASAKFLRSLQDTSIWDRAILLRYVSMLGATTTHLANATGNVAGQMLDIGLKPVAVGVDSLMSTLTGAERTRYMGEMKPQIAGLLEGSISGFKDAMTILKEGIDPREVSKLENMQKGWGSKNPVVNAAVEMPLRMLGAADAIFRGASFGGHSRAIATRQAINEGLTGAAREARVQEILENLDLPAYKSLRDEADAAARRSVYQEKRPGVSGVTSMGAKGGPGGYARATFLPFVRTPYNLAAQGAGLSPLGYAGAVKSLMQGNRGEFADRVARATMGTAVLGVADQLAEHGYLTGPTPEDQRTRSTLPPGWQPWSLRVPTPGGGATYVSFKNLGGLAYPLAMGAAIGDMRKRGVVPDVATAIKGTAGFFVDQSFLQGLDRMLDAITQPERYGEGFLESIVTPIAPASSMTRQVDRAIGMADRDPDNPLQALVAALAPGTAALVPEKQTALGEPAYPTQTGLGALLSPTPYGIQQDTPVLAALREGKVGIPDPVKSINVPNGRIDLTDAERRQLRTLEGEYIKEYVDESISDPEWDTFEDEAKTTILQRKVEQATQRARNEYVRAIPDAEFDQRAAEGRAKAIQERQAFQIGPVPAGTP